MSGGLVWPELALFTIVPALAIYVAIDGFAHFSRSIARLLRFRRPEAVLLLLTLLVAMFYFVAITAPAWDASEFGLVDYRDVEGQQLHNIHVQIALGLVLFDIAAILISLPVAGRLASRQGRSIFVWLALALLGSIGAVGWLLLNRAKEADLPAGSS